MCDTCPAILQDLRTLLGRRYMTLLTMSIVSRGDWLWNSANFKGLNNSAVSDVEETRHVTLTAHKFIQDGGQYKRSVFVGRRFWSHFGRFRRHWSSRGTMCGQNYKLKSVSHSSVVKESSRHLEGPGFDSRWGSENSFSTLFIFIYYLFRLENLLPFFNQMIFIVQFVISKH